MVALSTPSSTFWILNRPADFERVAAILKLASVKYMYIQTDFTIVRLHFFIYTCILTCNARASSSSVEKKLLLNMILEFSSWTLHACANYTCKNYKCNFFIELTPEQKWQRDTRQLFTFCACSLRLSNE